MCLITFAYNVSEEYPLILIANRDEFYQRATVPAHFWKEENETHILAGKDLQGGGTWLGVSKKGKWAALTNYRDLENIKEDAPTRGKLIPDFLNSSDTCEAYLLQLQAEAGQYNGFNLLLGDATGVYHFSNHTNEITKIEAGFHGVSNAVLNTPWPKLTALKSRFATKVQNDELNENELFSMLNNQDQAETHELPETGLSEELEKAMSSIFIDTPNYGTRCSTLLFIAKDGRMRFVERTYDSKNHDIFKDEVFEFDTIS